MNCLQEIIQHTMTESLADHLQTQESQQAYCEESSMQTQRSTPSPSHIPDSSEGPPLGQVSPDKKLDDAYPDQDIGDRIPAVVVTKASEVGNVTCVHRSFITASHHIV